MAARDANEVVSSAIEPFIEAATGPHSRPAGGNPNDPNNPPAPSNPDEPPPPENGNTQENNPNQDGPDGGNPGENNGDHDGAGHDGQDGDNGNGQGNEGDGNDEGGGGGCNSFSADTQVATDNGEVSISSIEVGDYVLAYNQWTGELGYYPVEATISHTDETAVDLVIDGESIETTSSHPFFTSDQEWVDAGDLQSGELVQKADGSYGSVDSIRFVAVTQPMYNLTVDEAHTFFVGEGEWLVHNAGKCPVPVKHGYNESGELIERVRARRYDDALQEAVAGNRAAARTTEGRVLDGAYNSYTGKHAELDIAGQLHPGEQIVELYSELQPCRNCQAELAPYLADNASVTYSFDWQSRAARQVPGSRYWNEYNNYIVQTREYLISRGIDPAAIEYDNRMLNSD